MMLVMLKLRKTKELPPSPDIANPSFLSPFLGSISSSQSF